MKSSIQLLFALSIFLVIGNIAQAQEDLPFKKELTVPSRRLASKDIFHISKQLERVKGIYFWEYRAKDKTLTITYDSKKLQDSSILPYLAGYIDDIPAELANPASPGIQANTQLPVTPKENNTTEPIHPVIVPIEFLSPLQPGMVYNPYTIHTPEPVRLTIPAYENQAAATEHPVIDLIDYMKPVQMAHFSKPLQNLPEPFRIDVKPIETIAVVDHPTIETIKLMEPVSGIPLSKPEGINIPEPLTIAMKPMEEKTAVAEQPSIENTIPTEANISMNSVSKIPEPYRIPIPATEPLLSVNDEVELKDPIPANLSNSGIENELNPEVKPLALNIPDLIPMQATIDLHKGEENMAATEVARIEPIEEKLIVRENILRTQRNNEEAASNQASDLCVEKNMKDIHAAVETQDCPATDQAVQSNTKIIFSMREPIKIEWQPGNEIPDEHLAQLADKPEQHLNVDFLSFDETGNVVNMDHETNIVEPTILVASRDKADNPARKEKKDIVVKGETALVQPVSLKKELLLKTDQLSNYEVYHISKQLEKIEGVHFWGYHVNEQTLMISYETDKIKDKSVIFSAIGKINKNTCLKELASETFYAFIDRTSKTSK